MKVSLILMLSWYADKYQRRMREMNLGFRSYWNNLLLPTFIMIGAIGAVAAGKHLSGVLIIGAITFFMLIAAGSNLKWLFGTYFPGAILLILAYVYMNPYALKRRKAFTLSVREDCSAWDWATADRNTATSRRLIRTSSSRYGARNGALSERRGLSFCL